MTNTETTSRFAAMDLSPEAHAFRQVPDNPNPLCRDFVAQLDPSAFWCGYCHWNRPMHDDERARTAIANELAYLAGQTPCDFVACDPDGGEPCATHERLASHAEDNHELCDHTAEGVR
jgi:hypothetical protein